MNRGQNEISTFSIFVFLILVLSMSNFKEDSFIEEFIRNYTQFNSLVNNGTTNVEMLYAFDSNSDAKARQELMKKIRIQSIKLYHIY